MSRSSSEFSVSSPSNSFIFCDCIERNELLSRVLLSTFYALAGLSWRNLPRFHLPPFFSPYRPHVPPRCSLRYFIFHPVAILLLLRASRGSFSPPPPLPHCFASISYHPVVVSSLSCDGLYREPASYNLIVSSLCNVNSL